MDAAYLRVSTEQGKKVKRWKDRKIGKQKDRKIKKYKDSIIRYFEKLPLVNDPTPLMATAVNKQYCYFRINGVNGAKHQKNSSTVYENVNGCEHRGNHLKTSRHVFLNFQEKKKKFTVLKHVRFVFIFNR